MKKKQLVVTKGISIYWKHLLKQKIVTSWCALCEMCRHLSIILTELVLNFMQAYSFLLLNNDDEYEFRSNLQFIPSYHHPLGHNVHCAYVPKRTVVHQP